MCHGGNEVPQSFASDVQQSISQSSSGRSCIRLCAESEQFPSNSTCGSSVHIHTSSNSNQSHPQCSLCYTSCIPSRFQRKSVKFYASQKISHRGIRSSLFGLFLKFRHQLLIHWQLCVTSRLQNELDDEFICCTITIQFTI